MERDVFEASRCCEKACQRVIGVLWFIIINILLIVIILIISSIIIMQLSSGILLASGRPFRGPTFSVWEIIRDAKSCWNYMTEFPGCPGFLVLFFQAARKPSRSV